MSGRWRAALTIVLALLCVPVAATPAAATDGAIVAYGCDDLVVIGRVATLGFTDLTTGDDLLGHGRFAMRVRIKTRLRGSDRRATVPATYIAHAALRSDRDFLLVLTPNGQQGYTLRSADLLRNGARPRLAPRCQ